MTVVAGRELDAEVARDVFGYRAETRKPDWYRHEVTLFFRAESTMAEWSYDENSCNACMYRNGVDESDGIARPLPFFSEEWEHAGMVIEHMRDIGKPLTVSGELTPLSVCLAALAAMGATG